MKKINKTKEDLKKGCGKEIEYIGENNFPICCGDIGENEEIILCPECKAKLQQLEEDEQIFSEMIEDWVENKLFKKIDTNGTGVKWFKIHNWKVEFLNELKSKINSSQRNERLGDDEELSFKKQSPANKEPEENSDVNKVHKSASGSDNPICAKCGHTKAFHLDNCIYGLVIGEQGVINTGCKCKEFVPKKEKKDE